MLRVSLGHSQNWLKALRRGSVLPTALSNISVSATRLAVSLVTMPALLLYLGVEGLGLWLVALSFLGLFGFINGGMTSAVVTAVGRENAAGDIARIARQVASANILAFGICSGTLLAGLPLAFLIDWHSLFSLSNAIEPNDVALLMSVLICYLAIGFPCGIPKFSLIGMQKGYIAHAIELITIIISAIALLTAIVLKMPIYMLAVSFCAPQAGFMLVFGNWVLVKQGVHPFSFCFTERIVIKDLANEGYKLAISQASYALANQTDLLLIGVILGAAAGTGYGVAQRIFAIPTLLTNALNQSIWPTYSQAAVEGRIDWVGQTFVKVLVSLLMVVGAVSAGLSIFYEQVVSFWLRQSLDVDWVLVTGMATLSVLTVIVSASGTLLRSLRQTGILAKLMVLMLAVNIPVSTFLIFMMGPAGAVWGTVSSYVVCLVIPYSILVPRMIATQSRFTIDNSEIH